MGRNDRDRRGKADDEQSAPHDRAKTDPSHEAEGGEAPDRRPTDPSAPSQPSRTRAETAVARKSLTPGEARRSRRSAPDEHIGKLLLGKYRIDKLIAKGGMGRVYSATQFPLERPVAIKILNSEYQRSDPQFVKRFFLEASIAAKLSHPHTITVFDYGEGDDGELFIAMELLIGRSLSRIIARDGPYDAVTTIRIAMQICRAVREAHDAGIIHRDLKPGNVFILDEGGDTPYAKVLDFGLVKLFTPEREGDEQEDPEDPKGLLGGDPDLTRTGTLLGSPKYMSPEQIHGIRLDPRTDIYSFGVILYQMITGKPPFSGSTGVDVIYKHVNHPVPSLLATNPDADAAPELEAIIERCLRKDRDERYASMNELLQGFKAALASMGSGTGNVSDIGSGPRPRPDMREASFRESIGVDEPTPTGLLSADAPGPRARSSKAPLILAAFGFVVALATLVYVLTKLPTDDTTNAEAPTPPTKVDAVEPGKPPPAAVAEPPPATKNAVDADSVVKKTTKKKKKKKKAGRNAPTPTSGRRGSRDAGQKVDLDPTYRDNPY